MEPFITLMNTDFDVENKKFTDRIRFDGYEFSVIVSEKEIDKTYGALDHLFYTPKMTDIPNIANMGYWKLDFYDDKGRPCYIQKNGEHIYFTLPHYNTICTDVSSGIAYLRIFHDTVKHLFDIVYLAANNFTQITGDY